MESHTVAQPPSKDARSDKLADRLTAIVERRDAIDAARIDDMYRLYSSNYLDTSPELFCSDLENKTHVLLLHNGAGQLCGFSTIEVYSSLVDGDPVRVIYSGDTIVAPDCWGSQALAFEWLRFAGQIERQEPAVPLFWLLIVKGHRTYRFLPTFARRYVPHFEQAAAPAELRIREVLATCKFGDHFDPQTGVVRFPACMGRLTDALADIPERHLRLPDVAHFAALNPGYRNGDELVCLCHLAPDNLRDRAARIFTNDARDSALN